MTGPPTLRRLDHVGVVVPELDEAIAWFVDVLGARLVVRHGPYGANPADPGMQVRQFARHPDTTVTGIAVVEVAGAQVEMLQFQAPDQGQQQPRSSDLGGHHLAFYVDDIDDAISALADRGAAVLGAPMALPGPESGLGAEFVYLLSPWGLVLELVTYPNGKAWHRRQSG